MTLPTEYRTAFDAVGDPLIVVDATQRIVVFNQAAEAVFGYDSTEIVGESLGVLLPQRFRRAHEMQVNGFRSNGPGHRHSASGRVPLIGLHRSGREFPAEVTLSTLEMGGEVLSAATIRDVSDKVEAERALAESEHRFRVIFDHSPVAMALVDLEGRLVTGNQALAELTGHSLTKLAETAMAELIESEDLPALMVGMQPVLEGTAFTARFEVRKRTQNGASTTIDLNLASVRDDKGSPRYLIGQAVDISARIEAQRRLEELVRSKDELIASVSHELRTPLTALVGFARLLHEEASNLSDRERAEMLSTIVAQSAELTNLVDDLLVAAKSETGDLAVVHVPVDLGAEASTVIEGLRAAERDSIGVVGASVLAIGDPARVRQIIRSLVANAIRYGGDRVRVYLGSDSQNPFLAVADNGPPIPEEDQARIFEPYQRAHETVGTAPSLGLGLWISGRLAQLMGGDLTLRRQDRENIFELTLPRA